MIAFLIPLNSTVVFSFGILFGFGLYHFRGEEVAYGKTKNLVVTAEGSRNKLRIYRV